MSKKIVAITSPRYEADIIESWCRHTLTFCDAIILLDYFNIDRTLDIVQELINEGLPIFLHDTAGAKLLEGAAPVVASSVLVSRFKRAMWFAFNSYGSDLALHLDPDEFLYHIDGINPREALEELPEDAEFIFEWVNYIYEAEPKDDTLFMPAMFTEKWSCPELKYYKTSCSKQIFKACRPALTGGRHRLAYPDDVQTPPCVISDKLKIAHFPLRSTVQTLTKNLTGRIHNVLHKLPAVIGVQFNDICKNILDKGGITPEQVREFSLNYAVPEHLRSSLLIEAQPFPAAYYEWPKLHYTQYTDPNWHMNLIRELIWRVESTAPRLAFLG